MVSKLSETGIANRFQVFEGRTRINVKLTEHTGEVPILTSQASVSLKRTGNVSSPTHLAGQVGLI